MWRMMETGKERRGKGYTEGEDTARTLGISFWVQFHVKISYCHSDKSPQT